MTQEQFAVLLRELEKKNPWGKNEIRNLLLNIVAGIVK